jgi:hypothetical protein
MLFFLCSCLVVYFGYEVVDKHLSILDYYEESSRKLYIQKNIVKAFYLALLSLISTVYFIFYPWDNTMLQFLAACYCSNDIVGLYRCTKLPISTRIHHVTSACFLLFTYTIDFTVSKVGQLLVYYTYFSALAWPVNLYLGLRLCFEIHPFWLEDFRWYCKWWYAFVCSLNWIMQIYLMSSLNIETGLYTTMIVLIVFDDIILLKWLFKNSI